MATEVEKIERLLTTLSLTQRMEVKKFLDDYDSSLLKRQSFNEQLEKSLGPMSSLRCAICGK